MRGKHPNSQDNLKPFKKGESGNPSGRRKSYAGLKDSLNKLADEQYDNDILEDVFTPVATHKERVHLTIWKKAESGDWRAIDLLEQLGCLD